MKKRSPVSVFILSIITFGIYDLYWLVDTKRVLNEKTRHHIPTIWLLIIPYVLLIAGYVLLFTSASTTTTTTTSNQPLYTTDSSSSSSSSNSSGEQVNRLGERRPAQYLHICKTPDGTEYVSQGTPECLNGDTYVNDYSTSVPGTVQSSPCETTSGAKRYVYVAAGETCPAGTKLLFYNHFSDSSTSTSTNSGDSSSNDSSSNVVYSTNTNTSTNDNGQLVHPALFFISMGLIFAGFVISGIASLFWFFRYSQAVNEYTSGKMSTAVSFLILYLIHLIGVALIQDTFNNMEETPAGPTGPVATPSQGPNITPIVGNGPQPPAVTPVVPGAAPNRPVSIYPEPTAPSIPGVATSPALVTPVGQPAAQPTAPSPASAPPAPPAAATPAPAIGPSPNSTEPSLEANREPNPGMNNANIQTSDTSEGLPAHESQGQDTTSEESNSDESPGESNTRERPHFHASSIHTTHGSFSSGSSSHEISESPEEDREEHPAVVQRRHTAPLQTDDDKGNTDGNFNAL